MLRGSFHVPRLPSFLLATWRSEDNVPNAAACLSVFLPAFRDTMKLSWGSAAGALLGLAASVAAAIALPERIGLGDITEVTGSVGSSRPLPFHPRRC